MISFLVSGTGIEPATRGSAAYPFCIIRSCELYQLSYPPLFIMSCRGIVF